MWLLSLRGHLYLSGNMARIVVRIAHQEDMCHNEVVICVLRSVYIIMESTIDTIGKAYVIDYSKSGRESSLRHLLTVCSSAPILKLEMIIFMIHDC